MKSFASVIAFSAAVAGIVAAQPAIETRSSCKDTQFFWGERSCCLEHGGPSNPPPPPRARDCPSNGWYWDNRQGCCVPRHPSPPEPTCGHGYSWSRGTSCCEENPNPTTSSAPSHPSQTPGYGGGYGNGNHGGNYGGNNGGSYGGNNGGNYGGNNGGNYGGNNGGNYGGGRGGYKHKRHHAKRNDTLCARGYSACPINGAPGYTGSSDYECLDTLAELKACGGCPSLGQGQDCTKIAHAKGVSCISGACAVSTCSFGYGPSQDGLTCIQL